MLIESVSTVASAAIALAMISPCVIRLSTRASMRPVAELVEIEDADNQNAESGKVEEQDPPRQAGEHVVAEQALQRL